MGGHASRTPTFQILAKSLLKPGPLDPESNTLTVRLAQEVVQKKCLLLLNSIYSATQYNEQVHVTTNLRHIISIICPFLQVENWASNLVPRAISAFKMAGWREEDPGEEQVMCLQKYWKVEMTLGTRLLRCVPIVSKLQQRPSLSRFSNPSPSLPPCSTFYMDGPFCLQAETLQFFFFRGKIEHMKRYVCL